MKHKQKIEFEKAKRISGSGSRKIFEEIMAEKCVSC